MRGRSGNSRWPVLRPLLFATAVLLAQATHAEEPLRFLSEDDDWVDLSAFLDRPYGFIPVVAPITEPAIGFGVALAPVFIDRTQVSQNNRRPNLAAAAAGLTTRGTWFGAAGYSGNYWDGKLRVAGGAMVANVNLNWYGLGNSPLQDDPLQYTIGLQGFGFSFAYQLFNSRFFVGLMYGLGATQVSARGERFDEKALGDTVMSLLRPSVQLDTRDSIFTPRRGFFVEVSATGFFEGFRASGRVDAIALGYYPLFDNLILGARADFGAVLGAPPFYLSPFVTNRGAPVMRYSGQQMADLEVELRWQFWRRLSLVGFGGFGATLSKEESGRQTSKVVFTFGGGARYELARRYQLHMGVDVAGSQAGPALYLVFGSAWSRL